MSSADDDRAPLIDPAILAERRAKRAEMSEERLNAALDEAQRQNDRLQGRADALMGELAIARDRRDEIAGRVDGLDRDLRFAHQREHAERQLRIETQDELAQARRDALGAQDELRSQLRDAHQRADEIERELHHSRRDLDHSQGLIDRHEAARARAEAAAVKAQARLGPLTDELEGLRAETAAEVAEIQSELDRRAALQDAFATQVESFRDDIEALRERHETDAARQAVAQAALRDVVEAAARMRVRLDQAQLLRAEAQERLTLTREQLDERDEEAIRLRAELEKATVEVASLRAQLHSQVQRGASALDVADGGVRAQLAEQAAGYEATLQAMRTQLQDAFEARPGAPVGPSPSEAELRETVQRLHEKTIAQAERERELATLVREILATARDVRSGHERELERAEVRIAAERDVHQEGRARLEAQLAARADAQDEAAAALGSVGEQLSGLADPATPVPAAAEAVIADLARAAQRLRSAAEPLAVTDALPSDGPGEPDPGDAADTVAAVAVTHEREWAPFSPVPAAARRTAPWLTPALAALAQRDRGAAADVLVALLALQGRTGRSVLYDLTIVGTGTWRVAVHDGVVDVVRDARRAFDGAAAFHVTGAVEDLAVLAGGGRGGLGPGARIGGSRRQARRLLRANRDPVGLADTALLLDPGQALALLAAARPPGDASEPALSLELCTTAGQTWHAVVDSGVLRTGPGRPAGAQAPAALRGSRTDLVTLLGGVPPQGVNVAGDPEMAQSMVSLLNAIQREPSGVSRLRRT